MNSIILLIGFGGAGLLIFFASLFIKDGLFQLPLSCLGGMLIGVGIGTSILVQRPTVLDFMRGKVDVSIQETYVDSILVKRDTIITYKNKMPLSCP